ncbi:hypothetical protein D3C86_2257190 [compost metagenome]
MLGLVEAVGVLGDAQVRHARLAGLLDELFEPLDRVGAALDVDVVVGDGGERAHGFLLAIG